MSEKIICAGCGKIIIPEKHTPGYGVTPQGEKICFVCCAERDRADMVATGRATLYLVAETGTRGVWTNYAVTNWPGTLRFMVNLSKVGAHNIAGSRHDVWFTDHTGKKWHGVNYGSNSQICHCRRLRGKNDH